MSCDFATQLNRLMAMARNPGWIKHAEAEARALSERFPGIVEALEKARAEEAARKEQR
jgi:hypothetical protein